MIVKGSIKIFYRTIASVVACVFLWQQVSWAGALAEDAAATTQAKTGLMTPVDLIGNQSSVQAAVDTKNLIENYSTSNDEPRTLAVEPGKPVYTYYTSGCMESMTLPAPDAQGIVYYHYIDEDWQTQGYGRVDKQVRSQPNMDGEIADILQYSTPVSNPVAGKIDNDALNDYVYNFGGTYGTWISYGTGSCIQLTDRDVTNVTVCDINNDALDEIVMDFGADRGIWEWSQDGTWRQIHKVSSKSIASGDINGDGCKELIIDFGSTYGIWKQFQNGTWQQIHTSTAESIVTGDINGDGCDELIIDFGSEYGIWEQFRDGAWQQIHKVSSKSIASGDTNGDGCDELIIDFGAQYGIWERFRDGTWQQIHTVTAESIVTGDINGDGCDELVIDFGAQYGIWERFQDGTWTQMAPKQLYYILNKSSYQNADFTNYLATSTYWTNNELIKKERVDGAQSTYYLSGCMESMTLPAPDAQGIVYYHYIDEDWQTQGYGRVDKQVRSQPNMDGEIADILQYSTPVSNPVAGKIDNDALNDYVYNFGGTYGTWISYGTGSCIQLTDRDVTNVTVCDINNDALDEIVMDFGADRGIWEWSQDGTWRQIHKVSSKSIASGDINGDGCKELIIDFGSTYGIWKQFQNGTWQQIHTSTAESIVTGDINGDGCDELIIDFGSEYGIWEQFRDGAWQQIHKVSSKSIASGDTNGDGCDELIIDFGAQYGIWERFRDGTWQQIHTVTAESIVTGDINGDGCDELVIDFGAQYGIWERFQDGTWTQMAPKQLYYILNKSSYQNADFTNYLATSTYWTNNELIKKERVDGAQLWHTEYYDTVMPIMHYQWLDVSLDDGVADVYREYDSLGRLIKSTANNGYYRLYTEYFGATPYAKYIREYDPQDELRFTHTFDSQGTLLSTAFAGSSSYYYQGGVLTRVTTTDGLIIDCGTNNPQAAFIDESVYGDKLSISVGGTSIGYIVVKDDCIWDANLQTGYTASITDGELFIRDANGSLLGHDYGGSVANLGTFYQPDGYSNEEWYGLVEWGGSGDGEDPLPRQAYYSMKDAYSAMAAPKSPYNSNIAQRPGRGIIVTDGSQRNTLGFWSGLGVTGGVEVTNWPDTPGLNSVDVINKRELKFIWNNPSGSEKWFSTNVGTLTAGFDASQYKYLMLRVKGAVGGESFKVQLQDNKMLYQESTILNMASYAAITKDYQDIYIPLADLRRDPAHLNLSYLYAVSLLFRDATSGTQSIYVDQIKLVKDNAAVSPKGVSTGPVAVSGNQIYVNGNPFEIKGVGYSRHDPTTYNRDFGLIAAMGANTIRTWGTVDQALLDSAASHGIKVAAGFWIEYDANLDPTSPTNVRETIRAQFRNYVSQFKNNPGLLLWSIGNENNLHLSTAQAANFYSLCNELGQIAYQEEGATYHPVAIVNSGYQNIGVSANGTTDEQLSYIDIWGDNRYPQQSFYYYEDYFNRYESRTDKPLFITEYGVDAWHSNSITNPKSGYEDEVTQASWDSAFANEIYNSDVCLGGSVFMFSDEWTKTNTQSTVAASSAFAYTRRTFGDGTIQRFDKNGNLVDTIPADGIKRYYDYEDRCVREVYADDSYADFIYKDGSLAGKTIFAADGSYKEYDAGGALLYSYAVNDAGSDASGLVSVTTSDGTIVYYNNAGAIKHVIMPDKVELFDVTLYQFNNFKDGIVKLPDGTIFLVRGGAVVQVRRINGSISRFADGLLQSEVNDGVLTIYNHEKDPAGALIKTTAENSSTKAVYDVAGKLKYSVKSDGSGILYEEGIVRAVFSSDGTAYLYDKRVESAGGETRSISDLAGIIAGNGECLAKNDSRVSQGIPSLLRYDDTLKLVNMTRLDGQTLIPGASGIVVAGDSNAENYSFTFDDFNCVKDITVSRDNLVRIYDKEGRLTSLLKDDGTMFRFADNKLSLVETPDGVTLKNVIADGDGNVTGYDVVESDGSLTSYRNGVIDHKVRPGGTTIRYIQGKINLVEEPDGKIYKYSYELDNSGTVTKTFKDLIQYRLSDGTVLELLDDVIHTMRLASGAVITNPVFDDNGKLLAGNIDFGNGIHGEIAGGILSKILLDDGLTELYYEEGRIAHAIQGGVASFDYEYTFDLFGNIIDSVVSTARKEMHYNPDGILTSLIENGYKVTYDSGTIDIISLDELGISIDHPVFDAQYRLKEGIVTLTDGSVYTFADNVPVSFATPEGALVTYDAFGSIQTITKDGDRKEFMYSRQSNGDITGTSIRYTRNGTLVIDDLVTYLKSIATASEELIVNRLPYNLFDSPQYALAASCNAGSISIIDHRFTNPLPDLLSKFEANYNITSSTTSMQVTGTIDFGDADYRDLIVGMGIKKDETVTVQIPVNILFYKGTQIVYTYQFGNLSNSWTYKTIAIPASAGVRPDKVVIQLAVGGTTPYQGKIYLSEIMPLQIKTLRPDDKTWTDSLLPAASVAGYLGAPLGDVYRAYTNSEDFFNSPDIFEYYGATPLLVEYSGTDLLTRITRTNGSILDYTDKHPVTMTESDGRLVEYTYSGPYVSGAKIFPEDDLINPDIVLEYEANRIKKATKGNVVYSYAYEEDSIGREIVVIKNESTSDIYRYRGELLLSATAEDGLVTEYIYVNKRLDASFVKFQDKLMESFRYSYADDLTIVTDEKGIRRTYDKNNRLIYLETADGLGYKYNYITDDQNNDLLEVELYQAQGKDGIIVYHKDGAVDHVQLRDGTIIYINDIPDANSLQGMTIKDGLVESVTYNTLEVAYYERDTRGEISAIRVEKDGVKRWYDPDGELYKLQSSPDEYYLYTYTKNANGSIDDIKVSKITYQTVGGGIPPVKLYVYSAGYENGWDTGIFVDDKGVSSFNTNWWWTRRDESWTGRGYDVVVVDQLTGEVKARDIFDTYGKGTSEADRMAGFINSVAAGDYVIIAIGDDGGTNMTELAYQAIERVGAGEIRNVGFRDSWAIIGRKGAAAGTVIEEHKSVGAGAVILPGYSIETSYYDTNGTPVSFSQYSPTFSTDWYSQRPSNPMPEMEPFSINSRGDVVGYIKSFNSRYANSGLIRIWDCKPEYGSFATQAQMQELEAFLSNAGKTTAKAIYFDELYPVSWATREEAIYIKDYFSARGYKVVDASSLRIWLKANGPDSALIMAQDVAPSTIVNKYTSDNLIRDYLDGGGTVVWPGDMPFYYVGYADGTKYEIGENGQRKYLGVTAGIEPRKDGENRYTYGYCAIPAFTVPPGAQPIDTSVLYFDPSVNYRDIDWHKVQASIGYELKEDTAVSSVYDNDGKIISVAKADRTVSVYNDQGKIDFVCDIHDDIISRYEYDADGNILKITLERERRDLEFKIEDAENLIKEEEAYQLAQVAEQMNVVVVYIHNQFEAVRSPLYAQRTDLVNRLNNREDDKCWFGWGKKEKNRDCDQLRGAIGEVDRAIANLYAQESEQIALASDPVTGEVRRLKNDIEVNAENAINDIKSKRLKLLEQIAVNEAIPVVHDCYRTILGRDPGTSELERWVAAVKASPTDTLDIAALKTELQNTATYSEYTKRTQLRDQICSDIQAMLTGYLAKTDAEKAAFLASLGLDGAQVISFTTGDIATIVTWLQSQNVHFARSAATIISELLKGTPSAIAPDSAEYRILIQNAILVDIFTGTINKFTEGDLYISAYSISRVAHLYGLNLTSAELTFAELTVQVATKKTPVFVDGNHYIVVLSINEAAGTVTYHEPSKGEFGETVTVGLGQFKEMWKEGYALTQNIPARPGALLTDYEAQKIRGACFFGLEWIVFGIISIAMAAIQVIASAVIVIVQSVVIPLIQAALGALVTFFQTLAAGITYIGKTLFFGLKFIGLSLFKGFTGFVAGIGSIFAAPSAGSAVGAISPSFMTFAGKTIVGIATNFALKAGLDVLGIDTNITNFVSAFVTGGIAGAIGGAGGFFNFSSAIGAFVMEGVNQSGTVLGLPPNITSILSMASGSIVNGLLSPGTDIANLFRNVAINVSSELAYVGITTLGDLAGIDPRISYLAGVGLRSTLSSGLMSGFDLGQIWGGVQQGLLQGVTNIGFSFATEELGISPLLANIGFSAISGAINAGIQSATGGSKDVFVSLFSTYKQNALTLLGYGDPSNAWQQAAYISQILDFSNIVQKRGLVEALNTYGAGFFNAVAVSNIVQSGYTIGGYFAEKLQKGQYGTRTLQDGKQVKEVLVKDPQGNIIAKVFFEQKQVGETIYWDIVGREDVIGAGSNLGWGELGVDTYGKLGYTDAELYSMFDSDIQYQRVVNGQQAYAEIKDLEGNTLLIIEPTAGGHYNVYDSYGEYVDAKINTVLSGKTYSFDDALLKRYQELYGTNSASLFDVDLRNPDTMGLLFNSLSLSSSDIVSFNFTPEQKQQMTYVILNGIGNPCPEGVAPAYMKSFAQQLAWADPSGAIVKSVAMFPYSGYPDANVDNIVNWIGNAYLGGHELTNDVINGMQSQFSGQIPSNMIGVAYSGSGDPFIQAVNENSSWDVKSIVLVDTPIAYGRKITNPNVNNVIMITGMDDLLAGMGSIYKDFNNNLQPLDIYKIALISVGHADFANQNSNDPTAIKVAKFSAYATTLANNKIELENFLNTAEGITYDPSLKMYVVDLSKVTYEN